MREAQLINGVEKNKKAVQLVFSWLVLFLIVNYHRTTAGWRMNVCVYERVKKKQNQNPILRS